MIPCVGAYFLCCKSRWGAFFLYPEAEKGCAKSEKQMFQIRKKRVSKT